MAGRAKRETNPEDPIREAFRRRAEAEFAARGREWAEKAPDWVEDWKNGGDDRQRGERLADIARKEAQRKAKAARDRDRAAAQREKEAEVERKHKLRMEQIEREHQERIARDEAERAERREQIRHDEDYAAYLQMIGATMAYCNEVLRHLKARHDPRYGIGPNKVRHEFKPPPNWRDRAEDILDDLLGRASSPGHYRTLGLADGATFDEVKASHRRLVMKHHPDRGGDVAEFRKVQEAFESIEDAHQRRRTG